MDWYPTEVDADKGIYLHHGVAYVLPRSALPPLWAKRIGGFGIGVSYSWSSWCVGFDILRAGLLIQIGPVFFWVAHISRQLAAFESKAPNP